MFVFCELDVLSCVSSSNTHLKVKSVLPRLFLDLMILFSCFYIFSTSSIFI